MATLLAQPDLLPLEFALARRVCWSAWIDAATAEPIELAAVSVSSWRELIERTENYHLLLAIKRILSECQAEVAGGSQFACPVAFR